MQDSAGQEAELVARMARGDREALAELFERFAPQLLPIGLAILKSRSEAEDLLHDVFLEAWRRARAYDPARGSVRAWLSVRMRSRALDRRKSVGVVRAVGFEEHHAGASATDSPQDPTRTVEYRKMAHALSLLSEAQQEVLVLGYFEGLSCSEMAERVGVPVGTVKSRIRAALAGLREAMEGKV